ncbi:MAG: hypothetical protein PVG07_16235, partial [Acidobacteriota bacterium]
MVPNARSFFALLIVAVLALAAAPATAASAEAPTSSPDCEAERSAALLPSDPTLCASLADAIRDPSALPLRDYEEALAAFLEGWCHRDEGSGWKRDKRVRDTGPFTAALQDGEWVGTYHGTHQPVVIWYSEEMLDWMAVNRPADGPAVEDPPPIPDGAVMIK